MRILTVAKGPFCLLYKIDDSITLTPSPVPIQSSFLVTDNSGPNTHRFYRDRDRELFPFLSSHSNIKHTTLSYNNRKYILTEIHTHTRTTTELLPTTTNNKDMYHYVHDRMGKSLEEHCTSNIHTKH